MQVRLKRARTLDVPSAWEALRWLTHTALRGIRSSAGFVIAFISIGLAGLGLFRAPAEGNASQLGALGGLLALLLVRLFERIQIQDKTDEQPTLWSELELGTLFVAANFVLIELTGGPAGLVYPLTYALMGFLVAFHARLMSVYFVTLTIGTEALIHWAQPTDGGWRLWASHASFNVLFSFLYALFVRTEIRQSKVLTERTIASKLRSLTEEANTFRLTSGARGVHAETESTLRHKRVVGSVQAIHESLYNLLSLVEQGLNPHTVALFWLDPDGSRLRLKELRSPSDNVNASRMSASEGIFGAIIRRGQPLILQNLRPGHPGVVYYSRPTPITDFIGIPVMEGEHIRGVLLADRTDGTAFTSDDVSLLHSVSSEVVRAVQVERIFSEMDAERYQKERFYEASQQFNSALTLGEVADVALRAARRVADVPFACLAVATEDEGEMRLEAIHWSHPLAEKLQGKTFKVEGGLVGAALKAQHPLPHGQRVRSQRVFDEKILLDLPMVKVFPLVWKDLGVGALVIGDDNAKATPSETTFEMLKVIGDHAAIAIANAQMYERMERMATTDGLTGLLNHRTFQEAFERMTARAQRYGRKLSLILTDIDHFKSINDTYGHPVGDQVLKEVAAILGRSARMTDVVARYGGEEFAVLMDETDSDGAYQMAERIRTAVEALSFGCEYGTFQCTLSLGVATFPVHGREKSEILELSDKALYQAKHSGRNRTVIHAATR